MRIETLLYVYLFICSGMIVFNIITAIVLKRRDRRTVRASARFRQHMKKLWTVRQRDRSRFSVMQRSEMEICSMTVLSKFVEGGSMKKYLLRRLVVPP